MHEWTERLAGRVMSGDEELAREFDAQLVECAPLAFRVAFSVLRHRQDAEDVAQEAFARAHRSFRQLRDPVRFRSWLVRMVWRMSLDRRRGDRRRVSRELAHGNLHATSADDLAASHERAELLWEAIDALLMSAPVPEHATATIAAAPSSAAVPQESQTIPPVSAVGEPPPVDRPSRPAPTRVGRREPEVLIAPGEADGVRYLLRAINEGRLDTSTWPDVRAVDVAITGLAPIEIEPLMAASELETGEIQ
jgi:RNA polymerase sigma factor (sigma-70 family)